MKNKKVILILLMLIVMLGSSLAFAEEEIKIKHKIITEREVDWEKGGFLTDYIQNAEQKITPDEILKQIIEIKRYFEEKAGVRIDLNDLEVEFYPLLEDNVSANIAYVRKLPRWDGGYNQRIKFFGLDTEDYENVVYHELGHYFENKFFNEEDFKKYVEWRNLDNTFFDECGSLWGWKPSEVFAEDFVKIFNNKRKNLTHARTLTAEQTSEFEEMIVKVLQKNCK